MRNFLKNFFKDHLRAQSASELAVFGAILIFVIGLIVRAGMGASQSMNTQLRAMRFALSESYRTAEGQYSQSRPSAARNFASILLIEDRLSVDLGDKMQTRDRVPLITSATGTFSRNLFYNTDYKEDWSVPIFDVFINGQRFPFTVAGFRRLEYLSSDHTSPPPDLPAGTTIIDLRNYVCTGGTGVDAHPPAPASGKKKSGICWQTDCAVGAGGVSIGCPMFYKVVGNYPNSEDWKSCASIVPAENASCNYRFDLNLDGTADVENTPLDPITGKSPRLLFAWQWVKVAGVRKGTTLSAGLRLDSNGTSPYILGIDPNRENPTNSIANVDKDPTDAMEDFDEETIFAIRTDANGVITSMDTMDSQMGDLNFGNEDNKPGLQDDVQMYSFTNNGTTFQIQEGKVIPAASTVRFARSTNRQEHFDIIQRVFKLSNDTGRFCTPAGAVRDWQTSPPPGVDGLSNPVEACGDCFGLINPLNRQRTCMDQGDKTVNGDEVIFIRSRIEDLRGRRWVTRLRQDNEKNY